MRSSMARSKCSSGMSPSRAFGHVLDHRAAARLGVPDLARGGELEVGDHHLVALAGEVERAGQRVDPGRGRGGDRDLVGRGAQQGGHARRAPPRPRPTQPSQSAPELEPVVEVAPERGLDVGRQQAVGAAVQIGLGRQGREARAQSSDVDGQGRPAGPRPPRLAVQIHETVESHTSAATRHVRCHPGLSAGRRRRQLCEARAMTTPDSAARTPPDEAAITAARRPGCTRS